MPPSYALGKTRLHARLIWVKARIAMLEVFIFNPGGPGDTLTLLAEHRSLLYERAQIERKLGIL